MTYVLPEKLKDLNPYDPVTEDFRIHLDANESFCEVPENIRQEILNAVSNVAFNRYPDPYARKLCEKAGAYYHVDPKLLTAGNGSDELISLVVPYFLDEGDTMLVAVPDFSMYWFYAPFHKIKVESLQKENSMKTSAEEILQRAKEKNAKLLIFSNPCNPTSLGIGRDDIIKIIEGTDALVIVDEAYIDFGGESALSLLPKYENLLVVRTYSKSRSMAGMRIGYAMGNKRLIQAMTDVKESINSYTMTRESIVLGAASLADEEYFQEKKQMVVATRERTKEELRRRGFEVLDSSTNFLFAKPNSVDAGWLFEELKKEKIFVRHFNGERIKDYLRISIGTDEQMDCLLQAIDRIMA